ncbi:hypothetical protein GCM10028857_01300 [Salinarchaeum chitinilyticum]
MLRAAGPLALASVAGCSTFENSGSDSQPVAIDRIGVLNRRSTTHAYQFAVRRDGETILARSRTIEGSENSSEPTPHDFSDWPDERHEYEFAFKVDSDDAWLRTTPAELGVPEDGVDCVRILFVINLGSRVTAHRAPGCPESA